MEHKVIPKQDLSGKNKRILIVHTRWNSDIVNALVSACIDTLVKNNVDRSDILVYDVPGAFELPFATKKLIKKLNPHAAISIGCLVKGETMHFEYICDSVSRGLMEIGLEIGVPVIFGVLTCLSTEQAKSRSGFGGHNHGVDWAQAAIEMAELNSL